MPLTQRRLGRTGHAVTFIGFGALEIGRDWGLGAEHDRVKPAPPTAGAVLNGVLDLGVNLIDTASAYHFSEERIGQYLAGRGTSMYWHRNAVSIPAPLRPATTTLAMQQFEIRLADPWLCCRPIASM